MKYKIPRYIDYEAKIFGPANFKQFLAIFFGMGVIGFLYLLIESFLVFVLVSLVVGTIILVLSFGKIDERPLILLIGKYLNFRSSGAKTYFWEKKEFSPEAIKMKEVEEKKGDEDGKKVSLSQKKGKLNQMSKKIETS